ncbi:hypothetical protein [Xenorhabdus sp. KK7.4]|uniref:hypothetical protein n=1 Tax=Xenorhabdus sp. KK7.4 TaxID=1851572 RepID=UPI000C043FF9|nr:hypothetical protein [Xenorhabdus sp. KK7.4]PHM52084.1 hypothetical protein Xekk_03309 [Xenorhabdus sp. KK7.4]
MARLEVDLSFDKHQTLLQMHRSSAYIRGVIGPAGSAKTTYAFKDLVIRSLIQLPANADRTRYTRWVVIRNTNKQLKRNTLETFKLAMGGLMNYCHVVESPNILATWQMDLPDGTRIHSEWQFAAMDSEAALGDALGAEMTGVMIDEASEIPEEIVEIISTRIGRYPSAVRGIPTWTGMLFTTNGPKESHWLYTWSLQKKPIWKKIEHEIGREYFELFKQPPALIRPKDSGGEWIPNPKAENIHNLADGYNYYYKMLGNSDDYIRAYVEGQFSPLKTGKVVFPEFRVPLHVISRNSVRIPDGAPVYLAFDFGRTPVMLIGIGTKTGRIVITDEVMGEAMAVSTLFDGYCRPVLLQKYSRNVIAGAWGDPAGADKGQAVELSPFGVLRQRKIPISVPWDTRNKMEPRIEAVSRRLRTLDSEGAPMLQICDNCVMTIKAIDDKYIYENIKGKTDAVMETPTKSHIGWVSDLMDALQYLCLGYDVVNGRSDNAPDERVKPRTRHHFVRRKRA